MDYKQLRRVLRERLDAPESQGDDDQRPEEEHHPVAVQELPVHDLPVNVADLTGEELVDPPVNDAEFLPGNLQQLQQATNVLVQQVPPLQIQDFYHRLRRLISTAIRQQNVAGENDAELAQEPAIGQSIERADEPDEPGSAEATTPEVSEAARRIRAVIRKQVTEHRVRRAVRRVLTEVDSSAMDEQDVYFQQWTVDQLIAAAEGTKKKGDQAELRRIDTATRSVWRGWDDSVGTQELNATAKMSVDAVRDAAGLELMDPAMVAPEYSGERAATGKTGSEEELLKIIADKLGVTVAAIRNILGRFAEDVGSAYAGDDRQRAAALGIASEGMASVMDTFGLLALMKYYDHDELKEDMGVKALDSKLLDELRDELINSTLVGSAALSLGGLDALKPGVSVSTFADAKNSFISQYLRDEFAASKMTYAYRDARGEETFTSRAGKEGTRPSRDPGLTARAIAETTASLIADYQKTQHAADSWSKTGKVTDADVNRWLSFLPDLAS